MASGSLRTTIFVDPAPSSISIWPPGAPGSAWKCSRMAQSGSPCPPRPSRNFSETTPAIFQTTPAARWEPIYADPAASNTLQNSGKAPERVPMPSKILLELMKGTNGTIPCHLLDDSGCPLKTTSVDPAASQHPSELPKGFSTERNAGHGITSLTLRRAWTLQP